MKYFILLLGLLVAGAGPAGASSFTPVCEADVRIAQRDDHALTGTLSSACVEYDAMNVRVTSAAGDFNYRNITAIRLGAQYWSAMGPHGAVSGTDWTVVSMEENGVAVGAAQWPSVKVEAIKP